MYDFASAARLISHMIRASRTSWRRMRGCERCSAARRAADRSSDRPRRAHEAGHAALCARARRGRLLLPPAERLGGVLAGLPSAVRARGELRGKRTARRVRGRAPQRVRRVAGDHAPPRPVAPGTRATRPPPWYPTAARRPTTHRTRRPWAAARSRGAGSAAGSRRAAPASLVRYCAIALMSHDAHSRVRPHPTPPDLGVTRCCNPLYPTAIHCRPTHRHQPNLHAAHELLRTHRQPHAHCSVLGGGQ